MVARSVAKPWPGRLSASLPQIELSRVFGEGTLSQGEISCFQIVLYSARGRIKHFSPSYRHIRAIFFFL